MCFHSRRSIAAAAVKALGVAHRSTRSSAHPPPRRNDHSSRRANRLVACAPDEGLTSAAVPPLVPLSVLDLSPITEGSTPGDALRNSLDLARHAERLGYRRHWVAEHHNMPGIASAATAVVVGHLAAGTSTIRVGAGGIMLPNHSPLVIAEQFGTLESLYPGRIDLGLGRAPGTDQLTARALRRGPCGATEFPQEVHGAAARSSAPSSRARRSGPCRAPGSRCRSGSSARAPTARGSPPRSASPTPSPRTSRPPTCSRRSSSTGASSGPRRSSTRPTRWPASTCTPPTPTRRPAPVHDAAAGVGQPVPRAGRPVPPADRRHRGVLDRGGEGAGVGDAHRTPSSARRTTVRAGLERSWRSPASTR